MYMCIKMQNDVLLQFFLTISSTSTSLSTACVTNNIKFVIIELLSVPNTQLPTVKFLLSVLPVDAFMLTPFSPTSHR